MECGHDETYMCHLGGNREQITLLIHKEAMIWRSVDKNALSRFITKVPVNFQVNSIIDNMYSTSNMEAQLDQFKVTRKHGAWRFYICCPKKYMRLERKIYCDYFRSHVTVYELDSVWIWQRTIPLLEHFIVLGHWFRKTQPNTSNLFVCGRLISDDVISVFPKCINVLIQQYVGFFQIA